MRIPFLWLIHATVERTVSNVVCNTVISRWSAAVQGMFALSDSMVWCVGFPFRHTFLPSGSMKITETRVSDSGMYLCVATNIAGNVTQSVKLSVHGECSKGGQWWLCPRGHSLCDSEPTSCMETKDSWVVSLSFSFIYSERFVSHLQITPPSPFPSVLITVLELCLKHWELAVLS